MPHKDKSQRNAYHRAYREAHKAVIHTRVVACNKRRRHENYAKLRTIKEASPCVDCGLAFPYFVMDFDHRDPATKVADVSVLVKAGYAWDRVLDEIAKCDLVCVRCHRLRTYKGDHNYRTRAFKEGRAALDAFKANTPCKDCEGFYEPCQMDLDHVQGKSSNVSQLVGRPLVEIEREIMKCHLVCANCHRVRTNERSTLEVAA